MAHPTKFGAVTSASLGLGDLALENAPLSVAKGGTASATASAARDTLGAPYNVIDPPTGFLRSVLPCTAGTAMTSGTAYFVYLGRTKAAITVTDIEAHVTVAGSSTQTAEMGLFSTPLAPNGSGQDLTKIVAGGSLDALNSGTGLRGFGSPISQAVSAGVHLWAGFRTAMASAQPTCLSLVSDFSVGYVLQTAGAGALTGSNTFTGAVPTLGTGGIGPGLRVSYS